MSARKGRAASTGFLLGLALAGVLLAPLFIAALVPARGDLADFFWPLKSYTAARWAARSLPLWNPLSGCGEPWLAQLQSGVFYPLDFLFQAPWPNGPLLAIALHLAIACAGLAAWLDDLGASRAAALAGGVAYSFGGAFLSLAPVFNNFCTAAYLPWLFLGARRVVRGRGVVTFTVAGTLAFLAGEPALAAAGGVAAAGVAFFARREGDPPPKRADSRVVASLVGAALLAAGLASVTALPFVELLFRSGRIASATLGEAVANPVQTGDLGDLVLPPRSDVTRDAGPGRGGYLGTLAFGPIGLFLVAGCVAGFPGRRRLVFLLAIVAAAGLILSLGAPGLLTPLLWALGPFRGIRFPARWFVFFHLVFAFAAGAGLDGWLFGSFRRREEIAPGEVEEEDRAAAAPRLARRSAALVFAMLLLFALLPPGSAASRDPARVAVAAAAAAASMLVVAAHRRWASGSGTLAGRFVVALLAGSLLAVARDPLEGVPAARLAARPAVVADLAALSPGRLFTTASDPTLLFRHTRPDGRFSLESPVLSHEALAGYTNLETGLASATSASPIPNPRLTRLLGAALAGGRATSLLDLVDVRRLVTPFTSSFPDARLVRRAGGISRYERSTALGRVFFAREARIAGDDEAFAALKEPGLDPEAVVYVAPAAAPLPPRRSSRGYAVARVTVDRPEEVEISTMTSEPAFLVVTQSFDPSWTGRVDGTAVPLFRVDLALTGVVVPAGEHRVALAYRPLSFRVGAAVSLASLLILAGLVVAGKRPEGA